MDKELKPFPDLAAEVEAAGEILISNHEHEVGALKARIKELEAKLRWIPVEERLPANGGSRLLAYGKDGYGYKTVAATSYDEEFKKFRVLTNVTHWRPIFLPEK